MSIIIDYNLKHSDIESLTSTKKSKEKTDKAPITINYSFSTDSFISHDGYSSKPRYYTNNTKHQNSFKFVSFSNDNTSEPINTDKSKPANPYQQLTELNENTEKLNKLIKERLGFNEESAKKWLEDWDKQMAEAFNKYGEDGEVSQEDINRLNALGDQVFENSKGNAGIQNQAGSDQAIMDKLTKDLLHERIQLMKEKTWINYWNANLSGIKASDKLASTT
jgi:hypothetical protein